MFNNHISHDMPKKSRFADAIGERYGKIEYKRGGKVLQRWLGAGRNVRLSHLYRCVSCRPISIGIFSFSAFRPRISSRCRFYYVSTAFPSPASISFLPRWNPCNAR